MHDYALLTTTASYRLLRVFACLAEQHIQMHTYGTAMPLYEAEIHLIKAIKDSTEPMSPGWPSNVSSPRGWFPRS